MICTDGLFVLEVCLDGSLNVRPVWFASLRFAYLTGNPRKGVLTAFSVGVDRGHHPRQPEVRRSC